MDGIAEVLQSLKFSFFFRRAPPHLMPPRTIQKPKGKNSNIFDIPMITIQQTIDDR